MGWRFSLTLRVLSARTRAPLNRSQWMRTCALIGRGGSSLPPLPVLRERIEVRVLHQCGINRGCNRIRVPKYQIVRESQDANFESSELLASPRVVVDRLRIEMLPAVRFHCQ